MAYQGWVGDLLGIRTIQDGGVIMPIRGALNFTGQVTVTDDSANGRTTVAVMAADVILTPPALTANQNNYAPTGLDEATVLRIGLTGANRTITGFSEQATNVRKQLINISSTLSLILSHNDAASTAANRILCRNNANYTIQPNGSAQIWYDAATGMWRVLTVG
jgi:hypothetical protein